MIIYIGDETGASANLSVGMIRTDTLGNVAGRATTTSMAVRMSTFRG
ncbi:MAG: hypothetical protein IPL52_11520 [Flavobacteriales bacterium]|nr:hypothetical protein [Flavobacteriales bacterium]